MNNSDGFQSAVIPDTRTADVPPHKGGKERRKSPPPHSAGVIVAVIMIAAVLGICLIALINRNENTQNLLLQGTLGNSYRYIPPQWITYRQTKLLEIDAAEPLCFAVVDDKSFVTGEGKEPALCQFDFNGQLLKRIRLPQEPAAVTFYNGKYAVAFADSIGIYTADGQCEKMIPVANVTANSASKNVVPNIRSIVCSGEAVFAADTASLRIYKFDAGGTLVQTFGEPVKSEDEKHFDGFTVYQSPITMTLSPKTGLLHIANPGKHRIETFTQDGIYEPALSWGYPSGDLGGFAGCCNPICLLSLPDGRTLTAEKGISRIKIYRTNRLLDCVVAGPGVLDHYPLSISKRSLVKANDRRFAAGVLPDNQIAVFDLNWKLLRIFTASQESPEPKQ